ncbi:MAG: DNA-formamidopyrimidine glycosylase [Coleofasciculaceae cyanobacterium SM2_1_6]|nr:DNA-formamidopyrimidine glycosylase [Coleofasciculaceae cyanobacterium SM2_1_6]
MPELPEVETVRLGLDQVTIDKTIKGGEVLLARSIAYPFSVAEFLEGLTNTQLQQWQRRGKYLLGKLVNSQQQPQGWLGVHLRMTGQLLWFDRGVTQASSPEFSQASTQKSPESSQIPNQESSQTPIHKHTRVRLFFADNQELRFVDQRTFGKMWWVPPGLEPSEIIAGLRSMGAEPLEPEFTVDYLAARLHKRQRVIKTALLDQNIVAGIGNIYADEALFLSGIMPDTSCAALTLPQITKLRDAIVQVLETSLQHGGTTFSDFLNVQGINGNYGGVAKVYNRTGQPCKVCQTPIERIKLGGRSTHFAPNVKGILMDNFNNNQESSS